MNRLTHSACLLLALSGTLAAQKPEWKPTEFKSASGKLLAAEYCYLEVPHKRGGDDERKIELAVARIKGKRGGVPLVYLHGGPGGSATYTVRDPRAVARWEQMLDLGDVILVDQRGSGRSKPSLYVHPDSPPASDVLASRAGLSRYFVRASRTAAADLRARGIDPSAFNNLENIEDLEDVRRALGADKVRILGFSYGSHLGLAYLRKHPQSIDSAVLIGVEGPDQTRKLPETLDTHWRKLVRLASRDPNLADESTELDTLLERTLAKLEQEPVTVRVNDPIHGKPTDYVVGPFGLRFLLILDLGDSSDIPVLPRLVYEVMNGQTRMLAWFVEKRLRLFTNFPIALFTMDSGAGVSAARAAAIHEQAARTLFANAMNFEFPEVDAIWKPIRFADDYRRPVVSDVRTLFISGELDSNTPPFQAERARWGFTDSVHLVAANAGHEACWLGNPKAIRAIHDFLAGEDVRHRDIDLPQIRFAGLRGKQAMPHPALRR